MGITNRKWCARRACPEGGMKTGAQDGQLKNKGAIIHQKEGRLSDGAVQSEPF